MFSISFVDLSICEKHAKKLYYGTVFLMVISIYLIELFFPALNGYYYDRRVVYSLLLIPLVMSVVAIFSKKKTNIGSFMGQLAFYLVIPFLISVPQTKSVLVMYEFLFIYVLIVLCSSFERKEKIKASFYMIGSFLLIISITMILEPFRWQQLKTAYTNQDPYGAGFHIMRMKSMFQYSHMFGTGEPLPYPEEIPERFGEAMLAYIAHEMGWFFALLIVFVFSLLFYHVLRKAFNYTAMYGRVLMAIFLSFLLFPVFYNIAMSVQLMPMDLINIPFLSFMGRAMLFYFVIMGLILNLDRRKMYYQTVFSTELSEKTV